MPDFIPLARVSSLQPLRNRQATSKQLEQYKREVHPIFEGEPELAEFEEYARRLKGIRIGGIYAAGARPEDYLSPNPTEDEDSLNNNQSNDDDDKAPNYRDTKVKRRAWDTLQMALPLYDKTPTEADQPPNLRLPLKPYQLEGLQRMVELEDRVGAVIQADDLGLGKIFQLLALIAMQKANKNVVGPTLIIVPKMLLKQWQAEIEKFLHTDAITFATYYKGADEHVSNDNFRASRLCEYDIVLTTYETIAAECKADVDYKEKFFRRKYVFENPTAGYGRLHYDEEDIIPDTALPSTEWARVVLDEGTAIKNCDSDRNEAVCALQGPKHVILTGTPYLCSYKDLGGYFRFLRIRPWGNIETYKHYFCNVKKGGGNKTHAISSPIGDILIVMLWFVVVRRTEKDVDLGLPDPEERTILGPFNKVREIQYRHPDDKEVYPFAPEHEADTQWMVRHKWDSSAPKVEGCTGASHIETRLSACHPLAHRAEDCGALLIAYVGSILKKQGARRQAAQVLGGHFRGRGTWALQFWLYMTQTEAYFECFKQSGQEMNFACAWYIYFCYLAGTERGMQAVVSVEMGHFMRWADVEQEMRERFSNMDEAQKLQLGQMQSQGEFAETLGF